MTYVDGFVIPTLKSKIAAYKKMATWGKKVWMKHGLCSTSSAWQTI